MEELFTNQNYYHNIRIYPLVQTPVQDLQKFDVFGLTLESKLWKKVGNWKTNEDDFWRCTYETEQEYNLYMDLERWKDRIEPFHVNDLWNDIKKRYNPFEYVYSPTPNYNTCVSRYHPISRSFFKLWEIMHDFQIVKNNQTNEWTVANLAEGPGGFMDCILNYRKNPNDILYGITLPPENEEIPSWSKIENKRKNQRNRLVYNVHYGNIYNLMTVQRYRRNFTSSKADFVTADGGFDYSADFNHQEQLSYRMILSEFIVAISIQKVGGDFVLKVFDILTPFTQKIIYLLTLYYNQVSIIKPYTSRSANSEKYIYCKDFRGISEGKVREWYQLLNSWSWTNTDSRVEEQSIISDEEQDVVNLQGITLSDRLKNQLIEYNIAYITEQKKYIQFMINNMERGQNISNEYNQQQIKNAIWWCQNYGVEISNYYKRYIFLNDIVV